VSTTQLYDVRVLLSMDHMSVGLDSNRQITITTHGVASCCYPS